jgi:hypothetical protein
VSLRGGNGGRPVGDGADGAEVRARVASEQLKRCPAVE